MRFTTLALAAAGASSVLASPAAAAKGGYTWSITGYSFCRGQSSYSYQFNLNAPAYGAIGAFTASCSGEAGQDYASCQVTSGSGTTVSSKAKIVTDPKNPNDSVPQIYVAATRTNGSGCTYNIAGNKINRKGGCGTRKGSKFTIAPDVTAVC